MDKEYIAINRESYDILASEYETKYQNNAGAKYFYELLETFVLKRKSTELSEMLEIGPGTGKLLDIYEKCGINTTAVELSKNMALLAKKASPQSNIINANVLEVEFLKHQFDFILAMAVIHNFPEDDLIILLNKIKHWLKPNGYFIIDTTNCPTTEAGYFEKEDYDTRVVRYRKKWRMEDLNGFLISQGFIIDELIKYKDPTSDKEWLVYALKRSDNHEY